MNVSLEIEHEYRLSLTDTRAKIDISQYAYEVGYFRFNWHERIEVLLVLNGGLLAFVDGHVLELNSDDILVINSNVGHATMFTMPNTIAMVLHLNTDAFSDLFEKERRLVFQCHSEEKTRYDESFMAIRKYLATIYTELSRSTREGTMFTKGAFLNLCATLVRYFPPVAVDKISSKANTRQEKKLRQIITYTEKHYGEKLLLESLAKFTGMNRTYLSTFFKSYTGISYYEYLTRKRLSYAIHLLNTTNYPLIDVAIESGFSDAKGLNLAFNRYFKISPNTYRKQIDKQKYMAMDSVLPALLDLSHPIVNQQMRNYLK